MSVGSLPGITANAPTHNSLPASIATQRTEMPRPPHKITAPIKSMVEVAPGISIYVEESGNPNGIPAIFVHGGPGAYFGRGDRASGCSDHQWFDPEKYRIIAFQQRGTMLCQPTVYGQETHPNIFKDVTIQTIAEDMEVLRKHLKVEKWLVFGGSWGSTMSIYYGQQYPSSCLGLVVRGIFLASHMENALFLDGQRYAKQSGEKWNPKALDRIVEYARSKGFDVSLEHPEEIYEAYSQLCVLRDDRTAQRIWTSFENYVDDPSDDCEAFEKLMSDSTSATDSERCIGIWETLLMNSVAKTQNLLDKDRLANLKGLPVQVVQGAKDNLCHPMIAAKLVEGLQEAGSDVKYALVEGGPHSPVGHPGMVDALVRATDAFADSGNF
jgi:proline iminopeptidase